MSKHNRRTLAWLVIPPLLVVGCKADHALTKGPRSNDESVAQRRPSVNSAENVETNEESSSQPKGLRLSDITKVRLGMRMEEITSLFRGAFPTDQPVLIFSAAEGGYYAFFFVETNEVEPPEPLDYLPLVAVAKVNNTQGTSGTYVLPERMRGLPCTGHARLDRRMVRQEPFTGLLEVLGDPHERVAIVAAEEIEVRKDTNQVAELIHTIKALPRERQWLGFRTLRSYPTLQTKQFLMKSLEGELAYLKKESIFDEKNALYIAESLQAVVVSLNGSEKGVPVTPAKRLREYFSTFLDQIRGAADSH